MYLLMMISKNLEKFDILKIVLRIYTMQMSGVWLLLFFFFKSAGPVYNHLYIKPFFLFHFSIFEPKNCVVKEEYSETPLNISQLKSTYIYLGNKIIYILLELNQKKMIL